MANGEVFLGSSKLPTLAVTVCFFAIKDAIPCIETAFYSIPCHCGQMKSGM